MPEGPEVRTTVDQLEQSLVGQTLVAIKPSQDAKYQAIVDKMPFGLPQKIKSIQCSGKRIYFRIGDYYMYCHLLMTGRWGHDSDGHRLALQFNNRRSIYFHDRRKFGIIKWFNWQQYQANRKEVGLDLLSGPINYYDFRAAITNPRIKKKPVHEFLTDQKRVAGIGNYLKAEILYRARIHPLAELGQLNAFHRNKLYFTARRVMMESYQAKGLTISDYQAPNGQAGVFKIRVYKQKIDPNGNPVERSVFKKGQQTTWWVPALQRRAQPK